LLAKDPARRPLSEALRRDLEVVSHRGTAAPTEVAGPSETTHVVTVPEQAVVAEPVAPRRRGSRAPMIFVALFALALLAVVAFALAQRDDEPAAERAASEGNQEEQDGSGGDDAAEQAPVAAEGWVPYTIADTGYQISYPEGWEVSEAPPQITFSDPNSSASFLVEYTTSPGDDAVAAWEEQAEEFAAEHGNYNEITIEPTTVEGFDTAAIWEFTYDEDGVKLHAIDVGMARDELGFAHFYQATEEEWESMLPTFEEMRSTFAPTE
jgi:hypothetical protein